MFSHYHTHEAAHQRSSPVNRLLSSTLTQHLICGGSHYTTEPIKITWRRDGRFCAFIFPYFACIILDGAELFGGGHFWDIPFLLCALVLFSILVFGLRFGLGAFHTSMEAAYFSEFLGLGLGVNGWVGATHVSPNRKCMAEFTVCH
jgi:hypothetical protein